MEIVQVVAIGIVVAIISLTVKRQSQEIGLVVSIAGSVLLFILIIPYLSQAIKIITGINDTVSGNMPFIPLLLKIVGISYIAEFGSQICADAGEGSLASKIELGGKALIMAMSAPIVVSLLDLILNILP